MMMSYMYRYSYKGSVNILIHDPIHKKRTMIYVNKLSNNLRLRLFSQAFITTLSDVSH